MTPINTLLDVLSRGAGSLATKVFLRTAPDPLGSATSVRASPPRLLVCGAFQSAGVAAMGLLCLLMLALPSPAATLVAHWQLDGNTNDSAGTNNASIVGSPAYVGGKIGQALEFDGANPLDYAEAPASPDFALTNFTIAAWVKIPAPLPGFRVYKCIMEHGRGTGNWYGLYRSGINTSNSDKRFEFRFANSGAGGTSSLMFNTNIDPDTWYHVAGTFFSDGTTTIAKTYLNGFPDRTVSTGLKLPALAALSAFRIGANLANGEEWKGMIDDVRIYDGALTDEEIAALVGPALTPVAITQEPVGFTATANSLTNLTVAATGDQPILYQWYQNNNEVFGKTNATLDFSPLTESDAGDYYVVVRNLNNSVTSQVATVTVLTDTVPPTIAAVQGVGPATRVVVVFSEPVFFADNPGNYAITNESGTITVWSAALSEDNSTVVLTTDPLEEGVSYTLVASGIVDWASNPLVGGVQAFTHSALVGYWPLDGDGTDLAAGNDGVIMGAPVVTQGRVGQALQFNRQATDHVQIPASPLYNLDEFTLSAWIKFPGSVPSSGWLTIVEHDRNGFNWYALFRSGTSAPRFHFRWAQFTPGGEPQPSSANFVDTFEADQWYHVAGTYANGTAKTYLNGELDNTIDNAKPPAPFTISPLRIGANLDGNEPFQGIIDEVRIYGRALSDAEIAALAAIPDPEPLEFLPPVISGGQIVLTWTGSGQLQSAPAVNGPWTTVVPQPAGQSYSEDIVSDENRFFRLAPAP